MILEKNSRFERSIGALCTNVTSAMHILKTINTAFFIFFLCTAWLLVSAGMAGAQPKAYRIGARDVITLIIYTAGKQQEKVDLAVSVQGVVNVPFIGPIQAGGLRISELEALITKPLARDFFVDPQVNIRIKEYRSLHYYLSGAVKNPGLYEMRSEPSLMELIAKAGGVSGDSGNVAFVLRAAANNHGEPADNGRPRAHKEPIKIDLKALFDQGDMTNNIILKPGDVVYLPPKRALDVDESKIYIEGEVKSPGVYDHQKGLTALSAIIMAGGFQPFAAPNRTKIIRQNGEKVEVIKINLNDVQKGKKPDLELKPGDRIHVPEAWL